MQPTKLETFSDNIVKVFSPKAALQRKIARAHMFRYEAANTSRLRQNSTYTAQSPESSNYQRDRFQIIKQARDLAENEPICKSILTKISNYALGKIKYQAMSGDAAWDNEAEAYFMEWALRADLSGRHSFKSLCQLLLIGGYRDGDGGFALVNDPDTNEIRLMSIEADRIGDPNNTTVTEGYCGGIEFDKATGRPLLYRIYHRGIQSSAYTPEADIPADSFIHFFDPMRMDQYRGISAFASSLNTIRDIHEILDAEKMAVKMGSSITGIVKSEMGDPLAGDIFKDVVQDPTGSSRTNNIETMEPGTWRYLQPGEDIKTFENNRPSQAFQGFLQMLVRQIALSVNLPYGFVYDLSGLSGPTVRQDSAQAEREFQRVQSLFTDRVLNPIKQKVIARAISNGDLKQIPNWNKGKWQFPAHVTIDVGRESQAAVQEVAAGMRTLADWYGEQGKDADEELEQSAKEAARVNQLAEKYNVKPEDIRMLNPKAMPQQFPAKEEAPVETKKEEPKEDQKEDKEESELAFIPSQEDFKKMSAMNDNIIRRFGFATGKN